MSAKLELACNFASGVCYISIFYVGITRRDKKQDEFQNQEPKCYVLCHESYVLWNSQFMTSCLLHKVMIICALVMISIAPIQILLPVAG